MKKLFFGMPLFLLACGSGNETTTSTTDTTSNAAVDTVAVAEDLAGTYEYVNPYNSLDRIENQYIVLEKDAAGNYSGRFYGMTDLFDPDRTEYSAGYFVLPMTNLVIDGETMSFELIPQQTDFFNETIDLSMTNSAEAAAAGLTAWEVYMLWEPRKLTAKILGGTISLDGMAEETVFLPMN